MKALKARWDKMKKRDKYINPHIRVKAEIAQCIDSS